MLLQLRNWALFFNRCGGLRLLPLSFVGVELHDIHEVRVIALRMSIHGIEDYVTTPGSLLLAVHLVRNSGI